MITATAGIELGWKKEKKSIARVVTTCISSGVLMESFLIQSRRKRNKMKNKDGSKREREWGYRRKKKDSKSQLGDDGDEEKERLINR